MPDIAAQNRPVAVVTGAGRTVGIGAAIAVTLADQGWDLALSYWTPADTEIFSNEAAAGLDELIPFLVSPKGRWVNGQLINSNGGFSVHG